MTRTRSLVAWLVAALILAACGTAEQQQAAVGETGEETPAAGESEGGEIQLAYVSPDPLGVNQFLIMGETGTEQAAAEQGAEFEVYESSDPTTRQENVSAAIADGATIVIVLGFEFNDILTELAPQNPDVQFLIVDQCLEGELPANVHCAVFREHEAAYLIGVAAATLSESGQIGAIGALDIPFLHRYTDAYAEGARSVNPDVQSTTLWVGGENPFADPARAKEQALALINQGVDHIFAATAGGNSGIFEAAEENNVYAYGVDVNQCPDAPGHVMENLIKRVDTAIVESVGAIVEGAESNVIAYGLAEGGLGITSFVGEDPASSECVIQEFPEVLTTLEEVQQQIIDGEIEIADPMAS